MLEKTLESPFECKEIKPVNLKEINLEYSLEGLVLKLKLQYFGHLMWRTDSFEKTLVLVKIKGHLTVFKPWKLTSPEPEIPEEF